MRENSFIPGTSPHPLACYTWSSCPAGWLVVRAPRPADDRSLKVAEIGRKPRHLLRKRSDPETNYPPPSPHKAQVASGGWLVFLAALPRTIVGPRKVHRTSVECSTSEARRRHNLAASAALSAFRFPLSASRVSWFRAAFQLQHRPLSKRLVPCLSHPSRTTWQGLLFPLFSVSAPPDVRYFRE